jgi:hypothetical protein
MNGIADLLRVHEYRFGFDSNCSCGAPHIWDWADYVNHIERIT